jgi:hypothetical protein
VQCQSSRRLSSRRVVSSPDNTLTPTISRNFIGGVVRFDLIIRAKSHVLTAFQLTDERTSSSQRSVIFLGMLAGGPAAAWSASPA